MNRLREYKEELEMVRKEKTGLEQQVKALKQVANISNDMLKIREAQVIHTFIVHTYCIPECIQYFFNASIIGD